MPGKVDAATLRNEMRSIISGFGGAGDSGGIADDPFNAPNEFEDAQRAARASKEAGEEEEAPKPKVSGSRRAQQAAAKAAKAPKPPADEAAALSDAVPAGKRRPPSAAAAEAAAVEPDKAYGKCKLPACADWWDELPPPPADAAPAGAGDADALRERAELLYEKEVAAHTAAQAKKHGADHRMMKKLLAAGTVKDKIAALTVQIQESSFHCLPFIRQLVAMAERAPPPPTPPPHARVAARPRRRPSPIHAPAPHPRARRGVPRYPHPAERGSPLLARSRPPFSPSLLRPPSSLSLLALPSRSPSRSSASRSRPVSHTRTPVSRVGHARNARRWVAQGRPRSSRWARWRLSAKSSSRGCCPAGR